MALEASFRELDARLKVVREAFTNLRVAVVENERLAREALCAWLEDAGARVAVGGSLAELEQALDRQGDAPDILLADYRLAEGTGLEGVEAVRRRFGLVPAVIVSGEADLRERGLPFPVLQKPVPPERLLEAMQAALARSPAAEADTPA